jgi:hypothetical protein
MRRLVNFIAPGKNIAAAVLIAVLFTNSTPGQAQTMRTLRGHVPDVISRLRPLADIAARTNLQLAVGLPLRNKAALTNLLQDLYDPGSPKFHRYLTTSQFTEQFGPSAEDYQKVTDYLTSHGLRVTATHPNRMVVDVAGAAADVEKAFHVHLRVYQHPTEQRKFFAPDTEPSVDAATPVLDVMGLDNYVVPHPLDLQRPDDGGPGDATVTNFAEQGSGPNGTYIGKDFRTAYVPGVTNTGAGQYIGLVEFGPYWTNDIHTYEVAAGLSTNIVVSNVFLDGVTEPPTSGTDAGEQALDIEMCISMAPDATVIYYGGNVVNDIYSRIASDNLAKQISCSFGFGIDSTTEQLYQEFVAQGQNFFVASGDGGAEVGAINPPAGEPYITVVGGTDLYTVTPGGAWQQELTWVGSGGGVSTFYAMPNYQQGINMAPLQGSSTMRNFPDVAMMADTVIFIAANNGTGAVGGTSCSSPQYAGFYALANQQAASLGQPPLGFFNPALYAIGQSSSYTTCFHDITSGNTTNDASGSKKFFAATGYDLCTGWGSPNGMNLINALTAIGTNNFMLYPAPATLNLTIGGSETILVTEQPMNGFHGSVSLSVSNLPTGVTASFSPISTTSTSILTLAAISAATPGTYTVTLNGASGSIAQTAALTINIIGETPEFSRVNLASDFNLAAIHTDGSTFSGGADGGGNAYSANLLGPSLNWNGCLFNEGSPNVNDAVQCSGQTILLPSGKYSSVQILAAAVGGSQTSQPFIVTYSDGSASVFNQSVSDWTSPQNFPGETVVADTAYRNTGGGTKDTVTEAFIYGYSFGLNNTKTAQSIKLPGDGNVLVFAITLANDFTLYGPPSSIVVTAGGASASYLVSGPVNGFTGSVNLSASGLPSGVTASFNPPSSTNASILTLTATATAQPINTNVTLTGTMDGLVHNMSVNLSVITPVPGAATVNLASAFSLNGIYSDGSTFSTNGGLDGAGNAYSASLLGSAPNWNGSLFNLGPAGAPDVVQCAGQTIALPAGQYTGLLLLGTAFDSAQASQPFQINYTDGTFVTVRQSISSWTAAQNYPGESVAISTAYVDTSGGTNNAAMPVNLYGYVFPLNDSKTVQSITLPSNPEVVVLAMTLANVPAAVSLTSAFNRGGIHTDGTSFSGGLDGGGYAYSATQLGPSQFWDSVQFKFGPANVNDVVACNNQTIALPANRYTTLLVLAAGVDGNQTSQTFTVTYTDGTTTPIVQSLSDWVNVTGYSNQFIAVTMPYRLFDNGSSSSASTHVFGYLLPLNNTKTVQSVRLPDNSNVEVLALALANTPLPVSLQADFNRAGIYTDGTKFTSGGLDNDGNALSATLLGPTQTWHNALFEFGQPNATNVISAAGQTVALPQGQYSTLLMLASCVNGSQSSQLFRVNYTNGTSISFSPSMSDWASPQHYSGETTVAAMGYRDSGGGSRVNPPVNVYGYSMPLNGNNVVQGLTLPNNGNVEVLAITLSNYTAALPEAPAIVTQPASLTVTNGSAANFAVTATGTPTLHYQWQMNGTNLTDGGSVAGSSLAALTLNPTGATNAGSYDVIVANAYGSVTSSIVTLNVVFLFESAAQNTDGSVSFSWLTTPGVSYQVQYTTNLASTNWINLGAAIVASNSVTTDSDTSNVDLQRFYRIIQQ